jgi:hypothetical protein
VLIEIFAIHNLHVFLQDHESDVQLLPCPLYVDLLMDLVSVSEVDSTFIYQAFNASSENEIQICIKKLVYQKWTRP